MPVKGSGVAIINGRPRPEYVSWKAMLDRCYRRTDRCFSRYGGRGITVCDRWRNSFAAFLGDMGARPPGTSIDRINNDGNYEPGNCRWATAAQQKRNTSTVRLVAFKGETRPLIEWCERLGLNYQTAYYRLKQGWTPHDALSSPAAKSRWGEYDHLFLSSLSLTEIARIAGCSYSSAKQRRNLLREKGVVA